MVLDGGLGTHLEGKGAVINDDSLWSAGLLRRDPKQIENAYLAYMHSGADVITTASYQASVSGFVKEFGVSKDVARELVCDAVRLAASARQVRNRLISGLEYLYSKANVVLYYLCLLLLFSTHLSFHLIFLFLFLYFTFFYRMADLLATSRL